MVENKSKQQKAEDFIGWKSPDGKLKVVGIKGKQGSITTFKVTCTECSKDPELFPDGYFVSTKGNLVKGKKPCGCSKKPEWSDWQYLILARRAAKARFIVQGFAENFKGKDTKLNLECLKDGRKWSASTTSVINGGHGCPECGPVSTAEQLKTPEHIALQKCIDICKEMDYDLIGFVDGYKNQMSRLGYICKIHGKQNVSYHNFVNQGRRCGGCTTSGYSTSKQGTFYIYQWTKDNHSFIKFGITNRKEISRIKQQKRETEYNYKKIWSATFINGSIPKILEDAIKSSEIEIGVILKSNFADGYTETTYIENINKIEEIIINKLTDINNDNPKMENK